MAYVLDVVAQIGILAILALSLNLIVGLTGLLHLGQAGFYAIGAYTAVAVLWLPWVPSMGAWALLATIPVAMLATALFALVIAVPCLRLRGDYLAIATLAFGVIVRLVVQNLDVLGGARGIRLTATPIAWWHVWLCVLATWVLLRNLKFSAVGRAFLAIREDEVAARAMGVNVPLYKTSSFLLCAAFAGLAGALVAQLQLFVSPGRFDLVLSIEVLLMVVLGGMGSFTGAILAAAALRLLRELLGELSSLPFYFESVPVVGPFLVWLYDLPYLGTFLQHVGRHRELVFALLLVLLIRYVPNGLLGMKEMPDWWRRWLFPSPSPEAAHG